MNVVMRREAVNLKLPEFFKNFQPKNFCELGREKILDF